MIYLDANAFYWYLGREKLLMEPSVPKHDVEKLRVYLDSRNDKSLPASVFIEMIVHFRDNPEAIKKIISFREEKRIKLLNNFPLCIFTPDELSILHITKDNFALRQYAYNLLKKKIDIEVKHAYVFLQVVSLLYADYYLETCTTLSVETKENVLSYLGRDISSDFQEDHYRQLFSALENGYADSNKSAQYLKKIYIDLLIQNCVIFQMIIDTMVKFIADEKDLFAVMCKSATDARSKDFTNNGIMRIIVDALATDSGFLKFAENKISDIFLKKGYSEHQSQYLKLMLEAWLERGQKLRKNDIFDMLCVGVLDKIEYKPSLCVLIDQSSYLISFDEIMMKFLYSNNGNARLIDKFLLAKQT